MQFFRKISFFAFVMPLFLMVSGCTTLLNIGEAIDSYQNIKDTIKLGDAIEVVVPKLNQAMLRLSPKLVKQPEKYLKNGVLVEIHFARSRRIGDGLTTDDEFTPYIFNDGVLVGIGWTIIGGPKSVGQVVPRTKIINNNTTIVR